MDCLSVLFEHVCLSKFELAMASLNSTDWCTWGNVSGYVDVLINAGEYISNVIDVQSTISVLLVPALQVVQQPEPLHGGDIGLYHDPVAQPAGGTDLCEHSLHVLPGLSDRGAQRPAADDRLRPGDHPHLPDPRHG